MTWLQLIGSIVDSLAWPVTIGLAAYLLRAPLRELLPNLRRLRYKELDIQFGEQLERLERELEREAPPERLAPQSEKQQILEERFEALLEISPSAAVIDAWIDIEGAIHELARKHKLDERRGRSPLYKTRLLASRQVIPRRLEGMLDELRGLRNQAAHPTTSTEISIVQARRYKEIADQVRHELQSYLN